jgi:hypothetical protein
VKILTVKDKLSWAKTTNSWKQMLEKSGLCRSLSVCMWERESKKYRESAILCNSLPVLSPLPPGWLQL